MVKYKKEPAVNYVVEHIKCDRCNKELTESDDYFSLRHLFSSTVYNNDFLEAEICEECLITILENEKVFYRIYDKTDKDYDD